jgi:hypothetical protein
MILRSREACLELFERRRQLPAVAPMAGRVEEDGRRCVDGAIQRATWNSVS